MQVQVNVYKNSLALENIFQHKPLEDRAAEFGGDLGLDGEHNWGEPVGREAW